MPRFAMTIDLDRCVGCQACSIACKAENDVPDPLWRLTVKDQEGQGARAAVTFSHAQCFHCERPACIDLCPTGATYKDANGIVRLDRDVCINCGYCATACPYAARHYDSQAGSVQKCDLCAHRLADGRPTACVEVCPTEARQVGDLDAKDSEFAKRASSSDAGVFKPELGQQPKLFYLAKSQEARSLAMNALPERGIVPQLVNLWHNAVRPVSLLGLPVSAAAVLLALPVAWRNARLQERHSAPAPLKPETQVAVPAKTAPAGGSAKAGAIVERGGGAAPGPKPASSAATDKSKKEGTDVRR